MILSFRCGLYDPYLWKAARDLNNVQTGEDGQKVNASNSMIGITELSITSSSLSSVFKHQGYYSSF